MARYVFILLVLCVCITPYQAKAFDNVGIVALVDNAMISTTDVHDRMKLVALSAGKKLTPEMAKAIKPQVVASLIDEHLYLKRAAHLKLKVSEEEIARAIRTIEVKNKLAEGQIDKLLAENGIPRAALNEQLRAQILWSKIISKEIQPKVRVSDAEVKEAKEHIHHSGSGSEVLISEIVLPLPKTGDPQKAEARAKQLVAEIRKGKPFEVAAATYSQSASAQHGGKVGWIKEDHIPKAALVQIASLKEGEITDPILTPTAYYIIKLHQRRDALPETLYETEVTLKQAFLPLAAGAPSKEVEKARQTLEALADKIHSCEDFNAVVPQVVPGTPTDAVTLKIKDLNPDVQNAVATLKVGDPSPVVQSATGMHLVTLCKRGETPVGEEEVPTSPQDETQIKEILMQQKIELQAKHYLRDLRQRAMIEVR